MKNLPPRDENLADTPEKRMERQLSEYLAKKPTASAPSPQPRAEECPAGGDDGVWSRINFSMRPEEMVAYLDQYIVRQDQAKAVLATKVCTHFNRARYLSQRPSQDPADGVGLIKNNVLMIGPTGVGKTYMVKLIAAKMGVPFVKGDATKFSETGYVGGDVEDLIRDLVHEAGDDLELAQYGIVYIDEVDKIASSHNTFGPDVSRTGVQRALLKPMEETEVDLKSAHDPISQIQAIEKYRKTGQREKRSINTRHILFIMSGAFGKLPEIIKERTNRKAVGFAAQVRDPGKDQEYFRHITSQDLVQYGFETEFVGRLPVTVVLEELTSEDLFEILRNPNNPVIISKKRDFASYGIELRLETEALRALAQEASQLGTGARALVSVVEKALLPFEKRLPSTDIHALLLTPEVVADPESALARLLANPADPELAARFEDAARQERLELLKMIAKRETLYHDRLDQPLTPARMDLIADEYYRVGMTLGAAFENVFDRLQQVREFEDDFRQRHDIGIRFSDEAEVALLAGAAAQGCGLGSYLERLGGLLEPGLKLAHGRTGQSEFLLPGVAVWDTDSYLSGLFPHLSGLAGGAPA